MRGGYENQALGKSFEELFERIARLAGFFVDRNERRCIRAYKGRMKEIEGNLDFTLVDQDGHVGFFDTKSVDGTFATYSHFSRRQHQVDRAVLLNQRNVAAGFVVYFREDSMVRFFSGLEIESSGPKSRFTSQMGVSLGSIWQMELKPLLRPIAPPLKAGTGS